MLVCCLRGTFIGNLKMLKEALMSLWTIGQTNFDKVEFDEFNNVKERADKFRSKCLTIEKVSKDSFYNTVLLALIFKIGNKRGFLIDENVIGKKRFDSLKKIKDSLRLSLCLTTFEQQCYEVNDLIIEKTLFLRVHETRNKFCYLIHKPPAGKNQVVRNLSSCVIQKYNDYQVVKIEKKYDVKRKFEPIDIVYDPLQNPTDIIECYFTQNTHVAYRCEYSKGAQGMDILHAFECYFCHKFHSTKKAFEKCINNCSQAPGILYKFDNKSMAFFEDHYRFWGDLQFAVHFDFETATGSDLFLDKKMYMISYCMIFAFHPKLKIGRIVVYRSFQQNQEENFDLSYWREKMLQHIDSITLNQLKDVGLKVLEKNQVLPLVKCFQLN